MAEEKKKRIHERNVQMQINNRKQRHQQKFYKWDTTIGGNLANENELQSNLFSFSASLSRITIN